MSYDPGLMEDVNGKSYEKIHTNLGQLRIMTLDSGNDGNSASFYVSVINGHPLGI